MVVQGTFGHNSYLATRQFKCGIAVDTLTTSTCACQRERTARYYHFGITAQTCSRLGLNIFLIPLTISCGSNINHSTPHYQISFRLHTFGCNTRSIDCDLSTSQIDISTILILVVGSLACRADIGIVNIALYSVIFYTTDI